MAAELTAEEEQATKQFLEEINKWTTQHGVSPLSWNAAVKFLMARKFDVYRAIELFHSYRDTRLKEGIVKLKPHEEPLRSELLSGKFTILVICIGLSFPYRQPYNQQKNRYGDVLCLDQTRVKLKSLNHDERTDYINASFMDGYKQKNAYIGTQGPLEKTYNDFWRMVWEQHVLVIVMTTRIDESGRKKCGQYWPLDQNIRGNYGLISVKSLAVENFKHYNKTTLEIQNTESHERRQVIHFQYLSWPDYGVPSSATALIDFRSAVRHQQGLSVQSLGNRWKGHPGGPPIVVHCSAGIGRTGTLCTLDICLSQLEDVGTLNIYQTVRRMRTQRAFSIQTPDQYYFCYTAIIEHAQKKNLLSANH
ncbi:tyrosine-protein phosphatase non-receptor type 9 [Stegostoma tigrinum]|uniref:tyrosine-protein phosphatase non-receptor type 9 n=1 Tax=Stegostoma tigrinum TaxID=3053191 RepID=UPI0028705D18|nr:tyrosine-protein phosphatase non-receptor type 9 [Stegostoma tigrinum]